MSERSGTASRVVVVGAGHAGAHAVMFLRQFGFDGRITLVGEEAAIPYQRPPLSKAWLKGGMADDKLALRPESFYAGQHVELRLGRRAAAIDRAAQELVLDGGERLAYDALVLATGSNARTLPLPGASLGNVLTLRSLADAGRLRTGLSQARRLVVIGGGFIGLECAASARELGLEVTVLERLPRLLERVASAPAAAFLQAQHAAHGVQFVFGTEIAAIEGGERAESVRLADGCRFPCDLVLLGVGGVPAVALAQEAGLACDNGVRVDRDCRTSDPRIFAIGDIARRLHPQLARELRFESVPNSIEQARLAAAVIAGREPGPGEAPWFWSDQYDLKLQMAGLPFEVDQVVTRSDGGTARFAVFHLSQGRLVTVEAINYPQIFVAGRKLIGSGKTVAAARLADPAIAPADLAG